MRLIYILLFFLLSINMYAQKLGPSTISSTGHYFETENILLHGALGEPINTVISDGEIIVSQGVLQVLIKDIEPTNSACEASIKGTLFFENCDDGTLYFFIRTEDGTVYDPYYADGVEIDHTEGELEVNFAFEDINFGTPCSIAEKAILITCIEEVKRVEESDAIFTTFPWLSEYLDPTTCNGERVTVYQSGPYQFLYLDTPSGGSLYLENGTFYCFDFPDYDCRAAYNLTEVVDSWTCPGFQESSSEERGKTDLEPIGLSFFPNPTMGQVSIQIIPNLEQEQQLRLVDLSGRVLVQKTIQPIVSNLTIDLSAYQNGVYYLELRTKGKRMIKKIIKQDLD